MLEVKGMRTVGRISGTCILIVLRNFDLKAAQAGTGGQNQHDVQIIFTNILLEISRSEELQRTSLKPLFKKEILKDNP